MSSPFDAAARLFLIFVKDDISCRIASYSRPILNGWTLPLGLIDPGLASHHGAPGSRLHKGIKVTKAEKEQGKDDLLVRPASLVMGEERDFLGVKGSNYVASAFSLYFGQQLARWL